MIDWKKLKREVQIFIAAVVFSLLLAGVLFYLHIATTEHWQQSSNQMRQATLRYQTAGNQKILLEEYQKRFAALNSRQLLGDEQRIDWIETIQNASNHYAIPSVRFTLNQRTSASLPGDITNIAVYVSKMRLDMNLLHEGDLFNLFAELDNKAKGLYGISRCTLKQEDRNASDDALTNSLNGNCEINWYTLGEPVEQQYDENGDPIPLDSETQNYGDGET